MLWVQAPEPLFDAIGRVAVPPPAWRRSWASSLQRWFMRRSPGPCRSARALA